MSDEKEGKRSIKSEQIQSNANRISELEKKYSELRGIAHSWMMDAKKEIAELSKSLGR